MYDNVAMCESWQSRQAFQAEQEITRARCLPRFLGGSGDVKRFEKQDRIQHDERWLDKVRLIFSGVPKFVLPEYDFLIQHDPTQLKKNKM